MWYSNYTHIVGEPTLAPEMRTFPKIEPQYQEYISTFPWMAPGSAPVYTPCGAAGGNPLGCPEGALGGPGQVALPMGPMLKTLNSKTSLLLSGQLGPLRWLGGGRWQIMEVATAIVFASWVLVEKLPSLRNVSSRRHSGLQVICLGCRLEKMCHPK